MLDSSNRGLRVCHDRLRIVVEKNAWKNRVRRMKVEKVDETL